MIKDYHERGIEPMATEVIKAGKARRYYLRTGEESRRGADGEVMSKTYMTDPQE